MTRSRGCALTALLLCGATVLTAGPAQTAAGATAVTRSHAASGSIVRGTLYLDDTTLAAGEVTWAIESLTPAPEASDVAAFQYEYKVR